jgi:AraC-like DNA-binding protein
VFGPGREYRSVLKEGWLSFEVVVSQHVAEAAGLPLATATERSLAPELSVIRLSDGLTAQFRKWARDLFDPALLDMPLRYRQLWADATREITLRLLATASAGPHGPSHEGVPIKRVPFCDLVLATLDYIDRNGEEQRTIRKTAQTLGISERALQYAFRNMLGVSPSQYILALRLKNARRDLLAAKDRSAKVSTIAFDHDFNHLSRFAQQYRRLFGESPSQTLRGSRMNFPGRPNSKVRNSDSGPPACSIEFTF